MAEPRTRGGMYTCPMHPEVEEAEPGACPFCGMALEPTAPLLEDRENPELVDFRRRLLIGAPLTVPVFALAMGGMLFGTNPFSLSDEVSRWLELAFATPVVLWCGLPFFQRGWSSLRTRSFNMFTLIAAGVGTAYGFSVVALIAPGVVLTMVTQVHWTMYRGKLRAGFGQHPVPGPTDVPDEAGPAPRSRRARARQKGQGRRSTGSSRASRNRR